MELGRSPTFVVGSDRQRNTLDALVKREQHFSEAYQKNKPLCFNAKTYQKTHPRKVRPGVKDADATLASPMLVGVADGVSQIEEFGIDSSALPNELLNAVEALAVSQLMPGQETDEYLGPISMVRDAYESTESMGSTTVLTVVMDNSTKIHSKLHPMIAVLSIGDCELMVLRRMEGHLKTVFHTDMQRIDGNAQSPLQLARVDKTVDPLFDESMAIEVIERGSAVHCVSAFEGDIVVLGSDGVFDNLFLDEIVALCEHHLRTPYAGEKFVPTDRTVLGNLAQSIVEQAHAKTRPGANGYPETPIGRGGKCDDTSCVVGEVVEWTEEHAEAWTRLRNERWWKGVFTCGGNLPVLEDEVVINSERSGRGAGKRNYPSNPNGSFSTLAASEYGGSFASMPGSKYAKGSTPASIPQQRSRRKSRSRRRGNSSDSDDDDAMCCIQ